MLLGMLQESFFRVGLEDDEIAGYAGMRKRRNYVFNCIIFLVGNIFIKTENGFRFSSFNLSLTWTLFYNWVLVRCVCVCFWGELWVNDVRKFIRLIYITGSLTPEDLEDISEENVIRKFHFLAIESTINPEIMQGNISRRSIDFVWLCLGLIIDYLLLHRLFFVLIIVLYCLKWAVKLS